MEYRMLRCRLPGWLLLVFLVACGTVPASSDEASRAATPAVELTVFAAASLTEAFTELGRDFEAANPAATVVLNFANSQQLAQQLGQGAPADVFASANHRQMQVAIAAGRVAEGMPQEFVNNRLVVVVPADNPGSVETLADLVQPGLKLVLAAEDAPIGAYSRDYLARAAAGGEFGNDYDERVLANVVSYEQTVKAVLTKVVLGEADAGIVYSSDVTPDVATPVQLIAIPDELNTIAGYPIAPISDSQQPALAEAFVAYVLSAEGQATLANFGFIPVR
jgi:molybdate transport system substrate-binding protein